jgi:hypothetical protein
VSALRLLALLPLLAALPAQAREPAPAAGGAGTDLPALLQRIGESTPGMDYLVKERVREMTVTSRTEERDGKGRVTHTYERVRRMRHEDGKQTSELLRALDDGRDVTAERRAEAQKRAAEQQDAAKKEGGLSFELPFTKENQARHRFTVLGPDAQDGRLLRVGFEPAGERDPQVMVGEALVDSQSGQVRQLRFRPSKFPSLLIDRLDVQMDFREQPGVGAVVSRLVVDGEGGLLFFKKRGRSTLRFADVVFKPVAPASATAGAAR